MPLLIAPNFASDLSKPCNPIVTQFPQSDSYSHHFFANFNFSTPSQYARRLPLSLFQLEVSCLNFNIKWNQNAKIFFSFFAFGDAKIFCVYKSTSIFQLERNAKIFCSILLLERGAKNFCSLYTNQRPSSIWSEMQGFSDSLCFCSHSAHLFIQININSIYPVSTQPEGGLLFRRRMHPKTKNWNSKTDDR